MFFLIYIVIFHVYIVVLHLSFLDLKLLKNFSSKCPYGTSVKYDICNNFEKVHSSFDFDTFKYFGKKKFSKNVMGVTEIDECKINSVSPNKTF